MANKRPFTDEFLREYSEEHLLYEITMLVNCVRLLSRQDELVKCASDDRPLVRNMFGESFAIHLRNLIYFYYGDAKNYRSTDVLAIDYLDDGLWVATRPAKSESLVTAENRAHKQIAHLTTERYSNLHPMKVWAFVDLANEIRDITNIFLGAAKTRCLATTIRLADC